MKYLFALLLIATSGCATPLPARLSQVKAGMDKTTVLDRVGPPKRTWRENNGDQWAYLYYRGEVAFERVMRFENGLLVSISSEQKAIAADKKQDERILRDYEKLVNESKLPKKSPDP